MENNRLFAEHYVLVWNIALKIDVNASPDSMDMGHDAVNTWFAIKEADLV